MFYKYKLADVFLCCAEKPVSLASIPCLQNTLLIADRARTAKTLRGQSPNGRAAKMILSHEWHVRGSVPVTFTAAKEGRGKKKISVTIKRQGCQRLEGKQILKGCMGFKPGTGLLKGKGNKETRLQRKHLQKAKLRRQVLLCAVAKQLRKKTRCYMGFFSLSFDQKG